LANLQGVVVRVQWFSVQMFRQFPYTSPASFSSSFFGVYQPSAAGGLAQWNPTLLVALPIPPGKSKENEAKEIACRLKPWRKLNTLLFWLYLKSHHDWKSMNSLRSNSTDFLSVTISKQITNQNKWVRMLLSSSGEILEKAMLF
jgi:hypothetical protein